MRFIFLLLLLFCLPAHTDELYALDPVVVTDSQSRRLLQDSPSYVQVLSKAMLENAQATNLEEALRLFPGVQLRDIHGKTGKGVYVQGLDSNRVLILLDGLPLSSTTGSTVDTSQFGTVDIERIEMIKGASSALYGSAAMGAVINIISKQPSKNSVTLGIKGTEYGKHQVNSGMLGDYRLYGKGLYRLLGGRVAVDVDHRQSQGYDLDPSTYSTSSPSGHKSNASALFALPISADNPADEAFIKLARYGEDVSYNMLKKGGHKGVKDELLKRNRLALGAHKTFSKHQLKLAYMHETQQDNSDQLHINTSLIAGNLWRESNYSQQKGSLSWLYLPQEFAQGRAEFLLGVEYFSERLQQEKTETKLSNSGLPADARVTALANGSYKVSVDEIKNAKHQRYELYSQMILPFLDSWQFTLGARWQHDEKFGAHSSPKLNLLWSHAWGKHQFQWRSSYALGYRVPDLKSRYFIFDHSINGYKVIGNADLKPETSHNLQASWHYVYAQDFALDLSVFRNQLQDLISATPSGKTEQAGRVVIYTYGNIARARTQGYEISSQWLQLSWLKQGLSYSYLQAKDLATNEPLLLRSTHQVKLNWDILFSPTLSLNVNAQIEDKLLVQKNQYSPRLSQWHANFKYRPTDYLKLYSGVNNLFNEVRDLRNPYDRRAIKNRHIYAGLEFHF